MPENFNRTYIAKIGVRTGLSLFFLIVLWIFRFDLGKWITTDTWKGAIIWGLVVLIFLDLLKTLSAPTKSLINILLQRINKTPGNKNEVNPIIVKTYQNPSSADIPISILGDDQLGFIKYAYILARYIAHSETPLTLGIHGEWGSGKTSLANLICCFLSPRDQEAWTTDERLHAIKLELEENGRILNTELPNDLLETFEIVHINAWQYASAQALWRTLILTLSKRVDEKGLSREFDKWQQQLYYSVSQDTKGEIQLNSTYVFLAAMRATVSFAVSILIPTNWVVLALSAIGIQKLNQFGFANFSDLFERYKYTYMRKQMESIEEFQDAFRLLVKKLLNQNSSVPIQKRRVIFIIDDLDRCLPLVALEIMETIKTFLDVQGCVYVLLCDQQLLGQGVKAKFSELLGQENEAFQKRGREYIEKIIQVSFQIPPSNQERLKKYAQSSYNNISENQDIPYFDIVYSTVRGNPRKIKRLLAELGIAFDMMELSMSANKSLEEFMKDQSAFDLTDNSVNNETTSANSAKLNKNIIDRKREFAKVFCLQYQWSETIELLQKYQLDGFVADIIPIGKKSSVQSNIGSIESENLDDVGQFISSILSNKDLKIFSEYLISINWEQAKSIGSKAVHQLNRDLLQFLVISPQFSDMDQSDLRDYIEWSGVIGGGKNVLVSQLTSEASETPIENLDLSISVYNALRRVGIATVGDILDLLEKSDEAVISIRNFGEKGLDELRSRMKEKGYLHNLKDINDPKVPHENESFFN